MILHQDLADIELPEDQQETAKGESLTFGVHPLAEQRLDPVNAAVDLPLPMQMFIQPVFE